MEQLKERPEALEALRQMLNHSTFFLKSIQNLSALEMEDDPIFTKVEVETLEKLVNDTQVSGAIVTYFKGEVSRLGDYSWVRSFLENNLGKSDWIIKMGKFLCSLKELGRHFKLIKSIKEISSVKHLLL